MLRPETSASVAEIYVETVKKMISADIKKIQFFL